VIIYRTNLDGCTLLMPDWGYPTDERAQWRAMVQAIAHERGYKAGWVSHMYKARWGEWAPPTGEPGKEVEPLPPTDDVRQWIEERIEAYRALKKATQLKAKKRTMDALRRHRTAPT
jgi:hypothetical protein